MSQTAQCSRLLLHRTPDPIEDTNFFLLPESKPRTSANIEIFLAP